jgi:hypothetical protein
MAIYLPILIIKIHPLSGTGDENIRACAPETPTRHPSHGAAACARDAPFTTAVEAKHA